MSSELAVSQPRPLVKASTELSAFLGMEVPAMISTLKAQCFKNSRPDDITDAQLAAFVSVANALKVNPLIPGFLYAYPTKNGGIEPIAGPDTTFKKLDEKISDGVIDGYECTVYPEDVALPPTHATCIIDRSNGKKPAKYTAIKTEWYVDTNPNWKYKMRHMLWLRAIKQAARQVIHGLPMDNDEYKLHQMQNVTPDGDAMDAPPPVIEKRPDAPARSKKGAAAVVENAPAKPAETQSEAVRRGGGNVVEADFTDVPPQGVHAKIADAMAGEYGLRPGESKQRAEPPIDEAMKAREAKLKAEGAQAEATRIAKEQKAKNDKLSEKLAEEAKENLAAERASTSTAPRVFLKDGEEITAVCEVVGLTLGIMNVVAADGTAAQKPGLQADVKGDFNGKVTHVGGATGTNDEDLKPLAPWALGATVKLKLLGKLQKKTQKVQAKVLSASAVEETVED